MKKNRHILIYKVLFFTILLTIFYSININNMIVYAAENSINETMSKEEIMEKYYELKEDYQELIDKFNDLKGEWSTEKDSIDDRVTKMEIIGGALFGILSILAMLGIPLYVKDRVKKVAENIIQKEISQQVPEEVAKQLDVERR